MRARAKDASGSPPTRPPLFGLGLAYSAGCATPALWLLLVLFQRSAPPLPLLLVLLALLALLVVRATPPELFFGIESAVWSWLPPCDGGDPFGARERGRSMGGRFERCRGSGWPGLSLRR